MTKKKAVKIRKTSNVDKMLLENFVSLQKVLVNLSGRLDNLTEKISKLLDLFEISAKSFSEKGGFDYGKYKDGKDLAQKIDSLLEQNRTFAKGIAMVYEKPNNGEQVSPLEIRQPQPPQVPSGFEGYQRSLGLSEPETASSSEPKFSMKK